MKNMNEIFYVLVMFEPNKNRGGLDVRLLWEGLRLGWIGCLFDCWGMFGFLGRMLHWLVVILVMVGGGCWVVNDVRMVGEDVRLFGEDVWLVGGDVRLDGQDIMLVGGMSFSLQRMFGWFGED